MSAEPNKPSEPDRRPLSTRELSISQTLAKQIAATGLSPNAISSWGMVAGVLAGVALSLTGCFPAQARGLWVLGAVLIQLRLLANMFDGMVAMETKTTSALGEIFNEVPDRVSDSAVLIGLGYAAGSCPAAGFLAACVALFVAYVRAMGKASGVAQDFCGPMAKPQRMFLATLAALWCGLTPGSWQFPLGLGVPVWVLSVIVVGGVVTAIRRLARIARALRILELEKP